MNIPRKGPELSISAMLGKLCRLSPPALRPIRDFSRLVWISLPVSISLLWEDNYTYSTRVSVRVSCCHFGWLNPLVVFLIHVSNYSSGQPPWVHTQQVEKMCLRWEGLTSGGMTTRLLELLPPRTMTHKHTPTLSCILTFMMSSKVYKVDSALSLFH